MEQELLIRCQAGDNQAFAAILAKYQTPVYNLAWRILQDVEEAKDATQDIFIRIYQALPAYRFEARFSTWLYRIATNLCLDRLRQRRKSPLISWEPTILKAMRDESGKNDPEQSLIKRETQQLVQQAIRELPPKYRTVIALTYLQEFSYREIADIMGVSVRTVETQIYRAKAILRSRLSRLTRGGERHSD